jgi:molecular chaperone GrpE
MTNPKPNSKERPRGGGQPEPHDLHSPSTAAEQAAAKSALDQEELQEAARELADSTGDRANDLDTLKQLLAEAENKALRYQADLDNYRRRARREADEQLKYANLGLINGILEAVDNLQRAVSAGQAPAAAELPLVQGVEMVVRQILDILKAHGCQPIVAEGQQFDPNLHQAVQMKPTRDVPPNTILQELRVGYRLHDRVVRPSQVIVSKDDSSAG